MGRVDSTKHSFWIIAFSLVPILSGCLLMMTPLLYKFVPLEYWILTFWATSIVFFGYLLFFGFWIIALNNTYALIPVLYMPIKLPSAVLLLKNKAESVPRLKRDLAVHAYVATCPVCSGRVDLQRKHWWSTEIIGVCNNNPPLHRFSFDITTNKGILLNYQSLYIPG